MRGKENPTNTFRAAQAGGGAGEWEIRERKAGHIAAIYDEAKIVQGAISQLWALDQACWRRMLDLQIQLVTEIHGLAPKLAENLSMMFYRLNNNHRICHMNVTSRTRILVFNEFLRRVGEFLDDRRQGDGKPPRP